MPVRLSIQIARAFWLFRRRASLLYKLHRLISYPESIRNCKIQNSLEALLAQLG
jgi:hypothetical protein